MVAIMPLKILNCREQAISRFDLVIERNGDVTTANEQYAFLVEDLEGGGNGKVCHKSHHISNILKAHPAGLVANF